MSDNKVKVKAIIFDDGSNAAAVLIDELTKDGEYNVLVQKVAEFKSLGEWMKLVKEQGTEDNPIKVFLHFPYEDYSVIDKKNTKKNLYEQVATQEGRYGDNLRIIRYYENRGNDHIEETYKHLFPSTTNTKEKPKESVAVITTEEKQTEKEKEKG